MESLPARINLSSESAGKSRKWLLLAAIVLITLLSPGVVNAQGNLYFVNTTSDTVVIGACQNGNPNCSLRGAIQAANAHVGEDGIEIDLPAGSVINLTGALPDLTEGVGISGPGADKLTVRRSTASGTPEFRIFNVTTTGPVAFSGMTISNGSLASGDGGGIQNVNSDPVNITNCVLSGNAAPGHGGGISNSRIVNVTNSTPNIDINGNGIIDGDEAWIQSVASITTTNVPAQQPSNATVTLSDTVEDITTTGTVTFSNPVITINGNQAFVVVNYNGGASGGTITNCAHLTSDGQTTTVGDDTFQNVDPVDLTDCDTQTIGPHSCIPGTIGCGWSNGQVITYIQNDWGNPSSTAGTSLNNHYNTVYAPTFGVVEVGLPGAAGYSISFTSAGAVFAYQPSSGPPAALNADLVDPTSTASGVFGGEVLALRINIDFSDAGWTAGSTGLKFGDLTLCGITSGPSNITVRSFLDVANTALGGGTTPYTIDDLTLLTQELNSSFNSGAPSLFAQEHLFNGVCPPISVSRKMHGAAMFDIDLPLTGPAGIECRTGGASGIYKVIVTFATPVTVTSASVTTGIGSVSSHSVNGSKVTVNLTGVANAQTIVITLFGVSDGTNTTDVPIPMGVLLGDTTADRSVNSADISQTKSKSGQAVGSGNFRNDVTVDGSLNSADISLVKSKSGTALP
jgi:CSLREA domain-containing protein